MKTKLTVVMSIVLAVLGIVLIFTPYHLFPVCNMPAPDGTPMKCAYSAKLIIAMGIIILIVNIIALVIKKSRFYTISYFITIISGLITYALPMQIIKVGDKKSLGWEIGRCAKLDHGCNLHAIPAIKVIVPIIVILAVVAIIMNFLVKEKNA